MYNKLKPISFLTSRNCADWGVLQKVAVALVPKLKELIANSLGHSTASPMADGYVNAYLLIMEEIRRLPGAQNMVVAGVYSRTTSSSKRQYLVVPFNCPEDLAWMEVNAYQDRCIYTKGRKATGYRLFKVVIFDPSLVPRHTFVTDGLRSDSALTIREFEPPLSMRFSPDDPICMEETLGYCQMMRYGIKKAETRGTKSKGLDNRDWFDKLLGAGRKPAEVSSNGHP